MRYEKKYQLCFLCEERTGRCSEDSLYDDDDESGPYCEECWNKKEETKEPK